jgi:uncharacterized LabA/DUF88 family protein
MARPTAILYVDGFNLYRRCLERYPELKWLDLLAFARNLMPDVDVLAVHYFTARIRPGTSTDLQKPQRQQVYLRALATLEPVVQVHLGTFRVDPREMVAHPVEVDQRTGELRRVRVRKIEEKGSDVNLAVRMVSDAHQGRADRYVMLTNDSDQAGTLRIVREEARATTGLILPMETARGSKELMSARPDHVGFVTRSVLEASQLPDVLHDGVGRITRPARWARSSEGPRVDDVGAF